MAYIKNFVNRGINVPYTRVKCLQEVMEVPSLDTKVKDYLIYAEMIMTDNKEAIAAELAVR